MNFPIAYQGVRGTMGGEECATLCSGGEERLLVGCWDVEDDDDERQYG